MLDAMLMSKNNHMSPKSTCLFFYNNVLCYSTIIVRTYLRILHKLHSSNGPSRTC